MMNMIFLVLQGFLMGHVAGLAFNGYEDPQFWAVLIGNSVLVALYGATSKN